MGLFQHETRRLDDHVLFGISMIEEGGPDIAGKIQFREQVFDELHGGGFAVGAGDRDQGFFFIPGIKKFQIGNDAFIQFPSFLKQEMIVFDPAALDDGSEGV
mgnify:CR=1 FL=1